VWLLLVLLAAARAHGGERPRNILLFIGDGMGVSQITAGLVVEGRLHLERFPTVGLLKTHSLHDLVTDSAAGATAMATGRKTLNQALSVTPEGRPIPTVVEYAEAAGKHTGIVATSSVTHATPAAFLVHVDHRDRKTEIARQIAESGVDVLFGGGWSYFVPAGVPGSGRDDGLDLVAVLQRRMTVARTPEEFAALPEDGAAAALLAPGHLASAGERRPSLAQMTRKAIGILSRGPKGFFLMVEGSQIDWAGHDKDGGWLLEEMADFDDAVGAGLDYAEADGHTLVVVTADHETGGLALLDGNVERRRITRHRFATDEHTAQMVPVFAFGPGSGAFTGIRDNTAVGAALIRYLSPDG
jgi:alkaline phosphatase